MEKKQKKIRVKSLEWGYGFTEFGEVRVSTFAAYCSTTDPTPVVIIPLKEVKRMCEALGIKFEPPIA